MVYRTQKDSPPSGVINGDVYKSTEEKFANMRKIMYYGWYGYEQWSGMDNLSDIERNTMMSTALSKAYSGTKLDRQSSMISIILLYLNQIH